LQILKHQVANSFYPWLSSFVNIVALS